MGKIIEMRRTESKGYKNLVALFEICGSVECCNFYLEVAEQIYQSAGITKNELYTLRRIGRQKRLKLAN